MKKEAIAIINKQGANREKAILKNGCYFKKGQWDNEHKVVEVISKHIEDGHADACAVDLVTGRIVG